MSSKYDKFLSIIIILIAITIVVLCGLFVYDAFSKHDEETSAEEFVDIFQQQYVQNTVLLNKNVIGNIENVNNNVDNNTQTTNNGNSGNSGSNGYTGGSSNWTNTSKYAGYNVVGTIQIPKINLKTPILKEVSPKALQKSVVLIYGNINEKENAVIIGHNNGNGTFFSNLKRLSNGDKITITDTNGRMITYTVYDKFEALSDDTSFYQRDTNGKSEITLSTCTDRNDDKRTIVLARQS